MREKRFSYVMRFIYMRSRDHWLASMLKYREIPDRTERCPEADLVRW